MHLEENYKGMEVVIEGGTKNEQYLVGAIASAALNKSGFGDVVHIVDGHGVDPLSQRLMYPSLLGVIRESRPDFLNTPVIVSAYNKPVVAKERRTRDRVLDQALAVATSYSTLEEELDQRWKGLSVEEKESLFETPMLLVEETDD